MKQPHAYVDREGIYRAPFPVAERLAHWVCEHHARSVLNHVHLEEAKIREAILTGRYELGTSRRPWTVLVDRAREEAHLHEEELVYDMVRRWCGDAAVHAFDEIIHVRAEVVRLQGVVEALMPWLRDNGHPVKAALVQRELVREDPR